MNELNQRKATLSRETTETKVSVDLTLEGTGQYQIETGNGMLDHLLAQLARHGLLDLTISARGDTETGWHHLVEDVAIVLGRALRQALGEGVGITRMAHALVPLDEALAMVALDVSGRGYAVIDIELSGEDMMDLPPDLVRHFLESFAREAGMNLHVKILAGVNDHHKAEAVFKALARALREAIQIDERRAGQVPSTKGTIT